MLNSRDEARILRAIRQSPSQRRKEELNRRVEAERARLDRNERQEQELYRRWIEADGIVSWWNDMRIAFAPVRPDEPWSAVFRHALNALPEAISNARDAWLDYIEHDREGGK